MRKWGVFFVGVALSFTFSLSSANSIKASANEKNVYVGGMTAGFTLRTGGVQVIGVCEVIGNNGISSPAAKAGLRNGDTIVKVGRIEINSISELNEIVNKAKGNPIHFEIYRGQTTLDLEITPIKEAQTNNYKIGVLVRDCVSGIGTITYIDKESGRFGALGHSVCNENHQKLRICEGDVYECSIIGIRKGLRGSAGELKGLFLNEKTIGTAETLCESGIFGNVCDTFEANELIQAVANSSDVRPGNAYIYSTVNGICPKRYDIEIVKVDKYNKENKNYVIKITDDELLSQTGGIVQGMSGSPILQNGKLIGAITHVFLNDPTRGYGIDIQSMLNK